MHPAHLELSVEVGARLQDLARRPTVPQHVAQRARAVLMVAGFAGVPAKSIKGTARELGWQAKTVRKWVRRVRTAGVEGLVDTPRPGRPRRITAAERAAVIDVACASPEEYDLAGYTKWSGGLLARSLTAANRVVKISARTVGRVLKTATIKPHRIQYWKGKRDPNFDAKAAPILDLYLSPPAGGVVVCADEKTAIQALERVAPDRRPCRPGHVLKREFEYIRHGTCCLTAGLFVHTGKVIGLITAKRPNEVFVQFLDLLHAEVAESLVIHLIVDNLNTHKSDLVKQWLLAHPDRLHIYYLPIYASWLNQIELWFRTLQRRCLVLADVQSSDQMMAKIQAFISTYNHVDAHPYKWTYTGEVLAA